MHRKPHGKSRKHAKTDFTQFSHAQLYAMLHAGEEKTARAAADHWDSVGARLHEQAGKLEAELAQFRQEWQGGAAEQYQIMINDLAGGLRRIGDAAFQTRDAAHESAEALAKAKAEMPPPVDVPQLDPMAARMATTPLVVDAMASPEAVAQLRQQQADAMAAVQAYQQAAQEASAAHAKAVAVMNRLAAEYRVADDAIPHVQADSPAPDVPDPSAPVEVPGFDFSEDDLGQPSGAERKPVFGNMFTAGLAAAAAASAGRFGIPRIPAWASKKDTKKEKDAKTGAAKENPAVDGLAKFGGGGGGIGKFGGGGGIGGAPVPTAHAGMLGAGPSPAAAAAALGAAAGAGGAAAGTASGMPLMPFMPFAPMGYDMAGARRVPPWLVETEEVWGESSIITPPVIGEEPPEEPNPSAGFRF